VKILHLVEKYYPSVGGMQEVVKQLSERMAAKGHDVTVITSFEENRIASEHNRVSIVSFKITGNEVSGMQGDTKSFTTYLTENKFDVVVCFAAQQWTFDALIPVLTQLNCLKIFVPTGFSNLFNPAYKDYFKRMPEYMKLFHYNVFLSNTYRDIQFARLHNAPGITVIPNGASEEEFERESEINIRKLLNLPADEKIILHVGSLTGLKGHLEAALTYLLARLRSTSLLFISDNATAILPELNRSRKFRLFKLLMPNKKIYAESFNREETIAAFKQSNLFLFPSKVECSPLVLFECMAASLPFATSDAGNAAEIISWSGGGIILPCIKDNQNYRRTNILKSAINIHKLMNDHGRMKLLSTSGYTAWKERFTWKNITLQYLNLYAKSDSI